MNTLIKHTKNTALFAVAMAVVLSGCVKQLEDMTSATKDEVHATNEKLAISNEGIERTAQLLQDMEELQSFGGAVGIFQTSKDLSVRAAAGWAIITDGPEDKVAFYIGTAYPIKYPAYQKTDKDGNIIGVQANVSWVSANADDFDLGKPVPITPLSAKLFLKGCEAGLTLRLAQLTNKNTEADKKQKAQDEIARAFIACPSIAGLSPVDGDQSFKRNDQIDQSSVRIVALLNKAAAMSVFTDEQRALLATMISVKVEKKTTDLHQIHISLP